MTKRFVDICDEDISKTECPDNPESYILRDTLDGFLKSLKKHRGNSQLSDGVLMYHVAVGFASNVMGNMITREVEDNEDGKKDSDVMASFTLDLCKSLLHFLSIIRAAEGVSGSTANEPESLESLVKRLTEENGQISGVIVPDDPIGHHIVEVLVKAGVSRESIKFIRSQDEDEEGTKDHIPKEKLN